MKKPKEDKVYLEHIDEFCDDLKTYLYEIENFEAFKKNKLYQDAVIRKFPNPLRIDIPMYRGGL